MTKVRDLIAICAIFITLSIFTLQRFPSDQPATLDYPNAHTIKKIISPINLTHFHPPFHTSGRYVVDSNYERFKLISVNWYGASDELFVVGGLNFQHRREIARTIRRLGFNSVRLPYSDQLVVDNPIIPSHLLSKNPDLIGSRAIDIFSAVVESLTAEGLTVIINNHITTARWCCDGGLCDGEWSNDYLPFCKLHQSQEDWIQHLIKIMSPHVENPLVIGVDLRNEVRGISGRFLWDSWASAAEEAADRLHLLQPEWLMFVEGVSSANDLSGVRRRPIQLTTYNKTVYSAHIYGWSGWGTLQPYWGRSYKSFSKAMYDNWAFLLDSSPVWIGEFGAPEIPNTRDLHYWRNLVRFMEESDVDFGYWALNPRKPHNDEPEGYGLLEDDWKTPRYDYRLYDMARLAGQVPSKLEL